MGRPDPDWPAFKNMTVLELVEGPAAGTILELTPTMRQLRYHGLRYFRMDGSRRTLDDGRIAAAYLWDGWWQTKWDARRREIVREVLEKLVHEIKAADHFEVEPEGSEDAGEFDRAFWEAEKALSDPAPPDYRALLIDAYTHLRGLGDDMALAPLLDRIDEALRDR